MQKGFFVHFVQQATLAFPRRDGLKEFLTLHLGPNITHLNDDERVLTRGSSGEENISIELTWRSFDTVAKVLDEGRRGCAMKATAEENMNIRTVSN